MPRARRSLDLRVHSAECVARRLAFGAARQAHSEHRTLARLTRRRDVAAHHARDLAGDGEAQARAAEPPSACGLGLAELLEQLGLCSAVMPMPVSATTSSMKQRRLDELEAGGIQVTRNHIRAAGTAELAS